MKRLLSFSCILAFLAPVVLFAAEPIDKHPEWDQEYSQKIRDFTTGPEFMTDLVDHLPASDRVPTPEKILGYAIGDPDHLTYAEDVYRYLRAVEAASPRVKIFPIGKTEEGREMILVAVADEETIANLDRYRDITRRLADPRKLTDQAADALIREGKPIYYVTGAMHSPETGSPEMLMELVYRLAVDDSPMIRNIRKNMITLITPVLEVDGRDRMVDTVRWYQQHQDVGLPPLVYWGHYAGHDNNRDAMGLALALSRNVLQAFNDWHPQVVHDLHESIPFLYISSGTGPYNAWLDPLIVNEWQRMSYREVQVLTEKGLPGVWTHGFYDGWAPNYMFWVALGHNALGRFYETFGNAIPSTQDRVVRGTSQREWFRPNPPLPKVRWSLRDNVNYQESGILLALDTMASDPTHFLRLEYTLGKRAVAKARTEGPAAYVFDGDQKRKGQLRELLDLLRLQGIEVQQTEKPLTVAVEWPPASPKSESDDREGKNGKDAGKSEKPKSVSFPAGSYVVRMDQPYSRYADALLDTQYVLGKEEVYDDTGWTLGYTKNLEFKRVVNPAVLDAPMHPWGGDRSAAAPQLKGGAILVANVADTDLARFRFALHDTPFTVTTEPLKLRTRTWPAGTVAVALDDSNRDRIASQLGRLDLDWEAVGSMPNVASRPLEMPRIAMLHTWIGTQNEGWYRYAFDEMGVPYDEISTQDVGRDPGLLDRYDVIVFPPVGWGADPQTIVNGMPPGPPIPWKKSDLTPNLGVIDSTDDIRPGLGIAGVANLQKFVERGGLLITVRDTSEWAVEYGLARWIDVVPPKGLKARGTILKASFTDPKSPIASGYDATLPVHFSGSPIFRVGVFRGRNRNEARPSGRGSKTDPDVPQGRPFVETPEKPKPAPGEEGFQLPEDAAYRAKPYLPSEQERPRVVLSFAKKSGDLLLSGMLEGGDEIAGTPVVIDSPLGNGHVLLFATNPMWRANTQGEYALIFNSIMKWNQLR
ncbi:MAG: M14 family zinc carboxypeptidase [Thermoanaerobaculia bacterium]